MTERGTPDSPLPEVQRYTAALIDTRRSNRRMVRNGTIAAVIGAVVLGVFGGLAYVKVDEVRSTQVCQARAFNVIGRDVHRLIAGDQNRADYPSPKLCR